MNAAAPDVAERERALDPRRSFLVQAPAGSGKTELLIQRYLSLLAHVAEPEEVLTVTFTRKAAGEVRSRVSAALRLAEEGAEPAEPHLRRSVALARAILADERRGAWQLTRHPSRLGISTLDSVNAWLAGRAPLSLGSGASRVVTDRPERLYAEAARATLALLVSPEQVSGSIAAVLRHLDNDTGSFERLLVAMLPRRDQWLRHAAGPAEEREVLEGALRALTEHGLRAVDACLDGELRDELRELLARAGDRLLRTDSAAAVCAWAGRAAFPAPLAAELPLWRALATTLLTREGRWRKTVGAREGFPAGEADRRRMDALLARCARDEALREALREVPRLPGPRYADAQWAVLHSLLDVLRHAAAELKLVFAAAGNCDFAEVAADALQALRGESGPTELGLALDHRVRHILVDEFQDTSLSQFELLQELVAGWEPDDGRTIFLVGDPMQSIYRFRQAEVGLFVRVREEGIGQLHPEPLRLTANFRSDPEIVAWVNRAFALASPPSEDPLLGAVRFSQSVPARARQGAQPAVTLHWLAAHDTRGEAQAVVEIAARCTRERRRVCILVRSRAHAGRILAALRAARIGFAAPDLEAMDKAGVALDLLALTRALLHPADRLAWIAVLRAPWCGLALADLHALVGAGPLPVIPDAIRDRERRRTLTPAGAHALERLADVLERVEAVRGRVPLRDLVEAAWLELGGPAGLAEAGELETADSFLALLETVDAGGDCADLPLLGEEMARLRGSLGGGGADVQVMTMHKAKGLEFDTVIVPGLDRTVRIPEGQLLLWHETAAGAAAAVPVLAPLAATGGDSDPLYGYLAHLERRKQALELDRLLYVACTRARSSLHLFARVRVRGGAHAAAPVVQAPAPGSLLSRLWPAVAAEARACAPALVAPERERRGAESWIQPLIRRLPPGWRAPAPPSALPLAPRAPETQPEPALEYEWAGSLARRVGAVVHRCLHLIAHRGAEKFSEAQLRALEPLIRRMLAHEGADAEELPRAADRVRAALAGALADPRGRWILSSAHAESACELPLTLWDGGRYRELVIDRTFVAGVGGRWIIDYKTSSHEGADVAAFLDAEAARHREQLRRYRDAMAALTGAPVRIALYFPLLAQFRELDAADDVAR